MLKFKTIVINGRQGGMLGTFKMKWYFFCNEQKKGNKEQEVPNDMRRQLQDKFHLFLLIHLYRFWLTFLAISPEKMASNSTSYIAII